MARQLLVLEEVLAWLKASGAPNRVIEAFRNYAETALEHREKSEKTVDEVTVASGYGQNTRQGFVEFTLNDQRSQMDTKKAREIGLMFLEAAEAAESDELFVKLLERTGLDTEAAGRMLIELRNIRHGTRGVSWPQ